MDIALFKEFIVTAQSRSLNGAAKKLFISTPTLSRHLAELEKEVGSTLISRDGMDFLLTPEGETFLESALGLVQAYDSTMASSKDGRENPSPVVTIGGNLRMGVASIISMNAVSYLTYRQAKVTPRIFDPHTHGSYTAYDLNDPIKSLKEGTTDISLLIETEEIRSLFPTEPIWSERLVVGLPVNHPLAQTDAPVRLIQLKDDSLVISTYFEDLFQICIEACRTAGFNPTTHTRICQSRANLFVNRSDREFFLFPEYDAPKIAPPELSGLVVKRLLEPMQFNLVAAYRDKTPNEGLATVLDAFHKAADALEADRCARDARRAKRARENETSC